MIELVSIFLRKKLSLLSIIFMLIGYGLIITIGYYSLSLDIKGYELFVNEKLYVYSYISNSLEIIPLLLIGFIIVLSISDCGTKANSFDAYFLVDFSKHKFYIIKLLSSLLIITIYYVLVVEGIIIMCLYRFKTSLYINEMISIYANLYLYIVIIFISEKLIVDLFNNTFITLIPLLLYYMMRLISDSDIYKVLKYIFVTPIYNYETNIYGYNIFIYYVVGVLVYIFGLDYFIYYQKDLKI